MRKLSVDVDLVLVGADILAHEGDRLMIFNGVCIGVYTGPLPPLAEAREAFEPMGRLVSPDVHEASGEDYVTGYTRRKRIGNDAAPPEKPPTNRGRKLGGKNKVKDLGDPLPFDDEIVFQIIQESPAPIGTKTIGDRLRLPMQGRTGKSHPLRARLYSAIQHLLAAERIERAGRALGGSSYLALPAPKQAPAPSSPEPPLHNSAEA